MTDRPAARRLLWPDVAKGACIVLVVLWHVTRKDYLQLPWDVGVPVTGAWGTLSEALLPVRMPLFFFVSGLFAPSVLVRPWRQVVAGRVVPLLSLFVLWTVVHTVVLQLTPGFDTAVASGPLDLLEQLTVTPGNLWYLLALAAYVVVARVTRDHPHLALLGAVLLSAVVYAGLVPTPGNRVGLLANLVWFLLGTRAVGVLRVPARRRVVGVTVAAVAAFAEAAVAWQALDADRWLGVRPALSLLGIMAGTGVAMWVARTRTGPWLAFLGRRTLPIYVLHLPLVALVHLGSERVVVRDGPLAGSLLWVSAYPALVTALVVLACLILHRALIAAGAGWLFAPTWGRRPRVRVAA